MINIQGYQPHTPPLISYTKIIRVSGATPQTALHQLTFIGWIFDKARYLCITNSFKEKTNQPSFQSKYIKAVPHNLLMA